jgi:TolB protein
MPSAFAAIRVYIVALLVPATVVLAATAPAGASFTWVNGKIVFQGFRDGNLDIYTVSADGSDGARLTTPTAVDLAAVFSADGTKIAFETERDGGQEIYTMDVDGGNQVNRTNSAAAEERSELVP